MISIRSMSDLLQSNYLVITLLDLARDNFMRIFRKKQVTVIILHNNLSVTYDKTKNVYFFLSLFPFLYPNEDVSWNVLTVTCTDT